MKRTYYLGFRLAVCLFVFSLLSVHEPFSGKPWAYMGDAILSPEDGPRFSPFGRGKSGPGKSETTQQCEVATPEGVFIQEMRENEPGYLGAEFIIKFRDNAVVGEVANDLLKIGQAFETLTGSTHLDDLNRKYKIKRMYRVFKKLVDREEIKAPRISKDEAKILHSQAKKKFREIIDKIKQKSGKPGQAGQDWKVPYLGSIYRVEVDPNVSIREACARYNDDPNVEYAAPDYITSVQFVPDDPFYSSSGSWEQPYDDLWGLKKMQTQQAWDTAQGQGIVVAVVDTGLDHNHPDIWKNVWVNPDLISDMNGDGSIDLDDVDTNGNKMVDPGEIVDGMFGWDFVNEDNDPLDRHGHGTHVSGTIAAVGNNGIGLLGVAPRAKVMSLKGFNDSGTGNSSDLADAIVYAVSNGAQVINNSWGCTEPCPSNPLVEDAVLFAHGLGVVVLFSAGNTSSDILDFSPQNMPESIVAAATTETDIPTYFTNFGVDMDVSAPGGGTATPPPTFEPTRNILSLKSAVTGGGIDGYGQLVVEGEYLRQAGTSMAAPHVSSLAALILGASPGFSVEQVRQAMRRGSDDIGSPGFDAYTGYGRINATKALSETNPLEVLITKPGPSPLSGVQQIGVYGIAGGPGFVRWTLEHAVQMRPGEWTPIASSTLPVVNDLMAVWYLQGVADGRHTLRLTAENSSGVVYEDLQSVILDNVVITDPSQTETSFFRSGDIITVKGTAASCDFSGYEILIWTSEDTPLSGAAVSLTNNGQQKVVNDVLGTWDTTGVPADHYGIELVVWLQGSAFIAENTEVIVDPALHPGWPKNIGLVSTGITTLSITDHMDAADIDGNGSADIVLGYGDSVVIFDHTGATLSGWPQSVNINSTDAITQQSPAVGDLTGDGSPEVVAANNKSEAFVWRADGTLLPGWPKYISGSYNSLSIDDLDGNGTNEIIATDWGSRVKVFDSDGNALPGWPLSLNVGSLRPPTIGDVDLDGKKEIAVVQSASPSNLYLLRSDGAIMPGWPRAINASAPSNASARSYPAFGDLDGDGDLEVVIGALDGQVYAFHHDGTPVNGWPQPTMGAPVNSPAIGDIDGDGALEVVAGTDRYNQEAHLFVWHGDGTLLPGWPVTLPGPWWHTFFGFGAPAVADVNDDGQADVIVSSDVNTEKPRVVHAYRGDGTELSEFPKPTATIGAFSTNAAAVADLDGDALLEMVWIDRDGNLYVWDLTSSASASCPWPMFHHDGQHTGNATRASASEYPPALDPIGDKTAWVNEALNFSVSATDPDGDPIMLFAELASGEPLSQIGANFMEDGDGSGVFDWTPSAGQAGDYDVIFTAADSAGLTDSETIRIAVEEDTQPICQSDADCDDGAYCNGFETCIGGECQPGTAPDCDDGVACTIDACDEQDGMCVNTPTDSFCDNGLFCDGFETCDAQFGCLPGTGPCLGEPCDELSASCVEVYCGNGVCEQGESCNTCPGDCIGAQGGRTCEACFKGVCDGQCHPMKEGLDCPDCAPSYCCGDSVCEGAEDSYNCEVDCGALPFCGDGSCGLGEDQCTCSEDCGAPPLDETWCNDRADNDCDGYVDCDDGDCDTDIACQSQCLPKNASCAENNQCCSNKCRRGTCR